MILNLKCVVMKEKDFEKMSPKQQMEIACGFEDNGMGKGLYGTVNADEAYRRDENGLEDMEQPSETGGYAPGQGK